MHVDQLRLAQPTTMGLLCQLRIKGIGQLE